MFNHTNKKMIWGALLACIGWGTAAHAVEIKFDFNSLSDGADNSLIQGYMNSKLSNSSSVTVTGAKAERDYTGDKHVTGPTISYTNQSNQQKSKITSETLGTSDGNNRNANLYNTNGTLNTGKLDTFIVNTTTNNDRIVMQFNGLSIYSVSFDFEIFPDGTCGTQCINNGPDNSDNSDNWPDFKFWADGKEVFLVDSLKPGSTIPDLPGDITAQADSNDTTKTFLKSPLSTSEKSPQLLATSGTWVFNPGVTKLEFIDWPRMIGIDNLVIQTERPIPPTGIPEPATVLLTGIGLTGLGLARRRTKKM